MMDPAKVKAFLEALSRLSHKHGVWIVNNGCGCCSDVNLEPTQGSTFSYTKYEPYEGKPDLFPSPEYDSMPYGGD